MILAWDIDEDAGAMTASVAIVRRAARIGMSV
jgi:hypothetical protein